MPKRPTTEYFSSLSRWGLIIGAVVFCLYLSTMPHQNVGYADSDEFITVGYHLGAAHPPGYPLYVALLYIATHLPLPISVAMKAHLLSAVFSAATVSVVFATAWRLYDIVGVAKNEFQLRHKAFERWWLSLLTALTLAFSSLFWLYGHIAEKYALLSLLTATTLYAAVFWYQVRTKGKEALRALALLAISLGLAISHHQTAIILIVPVAVLLWFNRRNLPKKTAAYTTPVVAFGVALLAPFTLLLAYASAHPAVSWAFPQSLEGLWHMISRADFVGQVVDRGGALSTFLPQININGSLTALLSYTQMTATYFGWWFMIPLTIAAILGKNRHQKLWYLLGSAALSSVGLAALLQWPSDLGSQAVIQRQYLMGYVPLSLFAWFGYVEINRRLGKALEILSSTKTAAIALLLIGSLTLLAKAVLTYPEVSLRSFTVIHDGYSTMLAQFAEKSLVTCYSDASCFALLYEQKVNGVRPDLTIIPTAYPLVLDTLKQPGLQGFSYPDNPYLLTDIITWNLDSRPVYAVDLSTTYYNHLGIDSGFMYYVPQGEYGLLTRQLPEVITPVVSALTKTWLATPTPSWDLMRLWLKDNYARNYIINGYIYLKMGLRPQAQEELNQAANLYFQLREQDGKDITALRAQYEQMSAVNYFKPGTHTPSASMLLSYIPGLLQNKYNNRALRAAQGAVIVEPKNADARVMLADLYEKMGDMRFATIEYQNALKLNPGNQKAIERLQALGVSQ